MKWWYIPLTILIIFFWIVLPLILEAKAQNERLNNFKNKKKDKK